MTRTFSNGTWTSELAARQAEPFKAKIQKQVLDYLRGQGELGATNQEIEIALNRPGNTIRPANIALRKLGLIEDSGTWRLTQAKRKAIVWKAVTHEGQ